MSTVAQEAILPAGARARKRARPELDAVDINLRLLAQRRPDLDLRGSEITARLFRLREIFVKTLDQVHARFGLRPRMFLVLGALYRTGPPYRLSPATLVRSLMWTSAGLSQLLDRMEAAGLIRREAHPKDRRALHVVMSPAGENVIAEVYRAHCSMELRLIAALNESQRRNLAALLSQLLVAMEGPSLPAPPTADIGRPKGRRPNARN
jgi:DNA-binding MarR family transcriptional regulator